MKLSWTIISPIFELDSSHQYGGVVDVAAALSLGTGTAIGAQIGAKLVPRAPTWLIKAIFGIVFPLRLIKIYT